MIALRTLALGSACLCLTASLAVGAEARGPEFGANKFTSGVADLSPLGLVDQDDFVGRLSGGEQLTVTVSAGKRSTLQPALTLIGPDGVERAVTPVVKKNGAQVQLKKYLVDQAGRWTVRVTAANGTRGEYGISFKIKAAKAVKLKKQTLGGADPLERTHALPGLEGSLLKLTLSASKKESLVTLRGVDDPASGAVPGALTAAVLKKTKTTLKKHVISSGDGDYAITVGIDEGTGTYNLTLGLKAPARPKGKKATHLSEASDPFLLDDQGGVRGATGNDLFIEGGNFSLPSVFMGDVPVENVMVDGSRTRIDFRVPDGVPGTTVDLTVVSPDGQSACIEDFFTYIGAPVVTNVTITAGMVLNTNEVPFDGGGTMLRVTGTELDLLDTVTLGGVPVTPMGLGPAQFDIAVPAGSPGFVSLVVTDPFGRQSVTPAVIRYVGFQDSSASRTPAPTVEDDFSGFRLAIGDLDRDTVVNDVLLATYNDYGRYRSTPTSIGTRALRTRLFFNSTGFQLVDETARGIPSAGSDSTGIGEWNARDMAVGDLDGGGGLDFAVVGTRPAGWSTLPYITYYDFPRLQIFLGGTGQQSGVFTLGEADLPGSGYLPQQLIDSDLTDDETGDPLQAALRSERLVGLEGTAVAIGDLDGDTDNEVVLGMSRFGTRTLQYDPADVDYTGATPYIKTADASPFSQTYYYSATRILDNRLDESGGFVDVTSANLPAVGGSATVLPAFHARDIALGDIDDDTDLDMIVTWNNPDSVTVYGGQNSMGVYFYGATEYSYVRPTNPNPQTATRVLVNNGSGVFTDGTAAWMPAASDPEYWQGHRVELVDLDGDTDLDMVLLHVRSLNAFTGADPVYDRHSLRILRNEAADDTPMDRFVDVTASALPALPGDRDDNLRGGALLISDINRDGLLDILVGTRRALEDDQLAGIPSTRLLLGQGGMTWVDGSAFLVPFADDSGEADDFVVGDLAGTGDPVILLVSEADPRNSEGGRNLRAFDWRR